MKKLQRKISVKAEALIRSTTVVDDNDSFEDVELTEAPDGNDKKSSRTRTESFGEPSGQQSDRKKEQVRRSKTMNEGTKRPTTQKKVKKKSREQTTPPALCQICYSEYTEPKILPCKHTFCKLCLEKYVNPKLMLECPTCRKEFQLGVLGVTALPDNLELKKDSEESENPDKEVEEADKERRLSLTGINVGDQANLTR